MTRILSKLSQSFAAWASITPTCTSLGFFLSPLFLFSFLRCIVRQFLLPSNRYSSFHQVRESHSGWKQATRHTWGVELPRYSTGRRSQQVEGKIKPNIKFCKLNGSLGTALETVTIVVLGFPTKQQTNPNNILLTTSRCATLFPRFPSCPSPEQWFVTAEHSLLVPI